MSNLTVPYGNLTGSFISKYETTVYIYIYSSQTEEHERLRKEQKKLEEMHDEYKEKLDEFRFKQDEMEVMKVVSQTK